MKFIHMNNLEGKVKNAIINVEQVLSVRREGKTIMIRYINDNHIDGFTFITEHAAQYTLDLIFEVGTR